jgi:L-lactate dehydrogenase complex protein LldG
MTPAHTPGSDPTDPSRPGAGRPADGAKPVEDDRPHERTPEEREEQEEQLEEALEDSFPASDPPSITQPVHKSDDKPGSDT